MSVMTTNKQRCFELFSRQWPDHVSFIEDARTDHLAALKTELGEDNLFHQRDGNAFAYHDQAGALKESERFFESLQLRKGLKTIFHYGLGAGYDFQAARQWLEEDPERLMIVLEDDFGLIKKVFEMPLAVEMLSHSQVLLVPIESNFESGKIGYPAGFEMLLHIGIRDTYLITISEAYEKHRSDFSKLLKQSLHLRIQDLVWLFAFSSSDRIKELIANLSSNLLSLPEMLRGQDLFRQFEGVPTLICAAGPSIKDQLLLIKQLKNRALLFGAGTGMNVLNSCGILPHFGCGIDPNRTSESRMLMNTAFSVPYFQTVHFNALAADLLHANKLFFRGPESYGAVKWMLSKLEIEDQQVHFNVSTTCACMSLAEHLKCDPIVFLGLDLSYTEQKRYPEGIAAHPTDKKTETQFIEEIPKSRVIPAVNSKGKRIFTRSDWINEGAYYTLYAKQHPELKLINGTVEGLVIRGAEEISLEEIKKRYLTRSYDLDNWVHVNVVLARFLPVTRAKVQEAANEWKESLERGGRQLKEMIMDLLDADDQRVGFPERVGTDRYSELEEKLKQEPIYEYLIKEMDFAFEKKKMRDMIQLRFHSHLLNQEDRYKKMLLTELYRLKYLHKYVEIQLKGIKKIDWSSLSGKSGDSIKVKEVSIPDAGGVFENGVLRIRQEELEIDLEDDFSPVRVKESPEKGQMWVGDSHNGECLLYDRKGWLKGRCFYKKGRLHGPSTYYGPDGNILAQGWFFNDKRQGVNLQFYPSGRIFSIQRFKDNLPQGCQEFFEENGEVKTRYYYDNGLLNGKVELFYANGNRKRIVEFLNGLRHGKELHWSPEGCLMRESKYEHGRSVGIARKWYANGQLKTEKKFLDDKGNYDLRKWSQKGKLIVEKVYIPDRISEEITLSQEERTRSLGLLKKKMEKLVNDQEN